MKKGDRVKIYNGLDKKGTYKFEGEAILIKRRIVNAGGDEFWDVEFQKKYNGPERRSDKRKKELFPRWVFEENIIK